MKLTFLDFNNVNNIIFKSLSTHHKQKNNLDFMVNDKKIHGLYEFESFIKKEIKNFFVSKNNNQWAIECSLYAKKTEYPSQQKRNNFHFYITLYNKYRLHRNITLQVNFNYMKDVPLFTYKENSYYKKTLSTAIHHKYFEKLFNCLIKNEFNTIFENEIYSNENEFIAERKKKRYDKNHYQIFYKDNYIFNTYLIKEEFYSKFLEELCLLYLHFFTFKKRFFLSSENPIIPIKSNIKRTNLMECSNKKDKNKEWNFKYNQTNKSNKEVLFFNVLEEFKELIK